ncbi:MAG TPA: cytochrome c [Roseiflexaceae bacterium]|jgi:mono/diheme cytochrome c family protein|nr:cytochrome c [Roseiflexaceae bacterium]
MYNQAHYQPYEESTFFRNGAASRPLEPGVVARQPGPTAESIDQTQAVATGHDAQGNFVAQNPLPVNEALIARGTDRFAIFCAPCHGTLANGKGVTARYFNPPPASLYIARLKEAPDGYLYDVITNGKGEMFSYASRIPVEDRWAIIAYIRQIQQNPPAGVKPEDLVETTPTPTKQQSGQQNNAQPTATP